MNYTTKQQSLVWYSRYDKFVFENRHILLSKYIGCVSPSERNEESYKQFCEEVYEELKSEVKN